jgi:NAD(P)-dependent dehydrogenase (short-subunit alcohol dehydrogenase family)
VNTKVGLIVGAGPGVSGSFSRLLAGDGWNLGLLGADQGVLDELGADLAGRGAEVASSFVDITDDSVARAEIARIGEQLGRIDLVHFNPSAFREKDPLELTVDELLTDVALGVGALLTVVQAARPFMSRGARVTATGSMAADEPWNRAASLGVQKAGLRNLVRSLDATLEPDGIRAVSVTVRGSLAKEGPFTPDRVGAALYDAAWQDEGEWRTEVPYEG